MRSRASSGVRPIAQAVISESGIGVAALALARARRASRGARRTPPASRRSCCTRRPTSRRGRSCRTGRCRRRSGADAACRPRSRARPRAAPRASWSRVFISGNGKPNASCSASIQPVPIPSETRPAAISFAVAETFARTAGARKVTGETSVPSSTRVVCAASAGSPPRHPAPVAPRRSGTDSGRSGRAPRRRVPRTRARARASPPTRRLPAPRSSAPAASGHPMTR